MGIMSALRGIDNPKYDPPKPKLAPAAKAARRGGTRITATKPAAPTGGPKEHRWNGKPAPQ
jgi:hypothetical protein